MTELEKEFLDIRRNYIKNDFKKMNDMQFSAVTATKGPVLILAGAGSGKTTVLVNRILNLVKYGDAFSSSDVFGVTADSLASLKERIAGNEECLGLLELEPVRPWEILAITFTNKAAGELKDRIENVLGETAQYLKAGTFHSICSKILRRYGDLLGYDSHYTIYDTDDQKRVMKDVYKNIGIDEKQLNIKTSLNAISRAKDRLVSPTRYASEMVSTDPAQKIISKAYFEYQKMLKDANAMDFDDLISNTVKLFSKHPDVLEYYQDRIKYIMVDEYQDTNHAQYMFVKLLAQKNRNICVVGDDDQSIYRFRGATIENILNFENEYPDATVIRLEQNYRSTQNILDAANAVIANNFGRTGKNMWTSNGGGDKISYTTAESEVDEAQYVSECILNHIRLGGKFSDCAVLYRMNAQSSNIERAFVRTGIPYKIIGGLRFYDRKEIKDILAYLQVINNTSDNVRLRRIINEPKRGIGATTLNNASEIAGNIGISLFEVFENSEDYPILSRAAQKLKSFCSTIRELQDSAENLQLHELLLDTVEKTGYGSYLKTLPKEESERAENVKELVTTVMQYEEENEEPTLSGFLEEVSLISDIDSYEENSDCVVMMTLHSAKGLEFDTVFLIGLEEGIFPGNQAIYDGPEEIEEERRIAYVGITRAKRKLYVTNAFRRMIYGQTSYNKPSRFVEEIPNDLCEITSRAVSGIDAFSRQTPAYSRRPNFNTKGSKSTSIPINYGVGDRVAHSAFGDGTVVKMTPMGNDFLTEINFDSVGIKKLMSNFAKLTKL